MINISGSLGANQTTYIHNGLLIYLKLNKFMPQVIRNLNKQKKNRAPYHSLATAMQCLHVRADAGFF